MRQSDVNGDAVNRAARDLCELALQEGREFRSTNQQRRFDERDGTIVLTLSFRTIDMAQQLVDTRGDAVWHNADMWRGLVVERLEFAKVCVAPLAAQQYYQPLFAF